MINSRQLSDLQPDMMLKAMEFIKRCAEAGYDVIITSTLRDFESQTALFNQGRVTKGSIVTNARAGSSYHNYGVAFDYAPIKNGKIDWRDTAAFTKCGEIAESIGLEWSGRWEGKLREMAHCQRKGVTIEQLKAKYPQGWKGNKK